METTSLIGALMQLRRGRVLTPQESHQACVHLGHSPALVGNSVMAAVPQWLVAQLENDEIPRQQRLAVLTTKDKQDPVLVLVVQTGTAQLRLLMRIKFDRVQALLKDAQSQGTLHVMLFVEHVNRVSILSTPMPDDTDGLLPSMVDATRSQPGQFVRVLELGAQLTLPKAMPSVIDGETVLDVVAVLLADDDAVEELADDEVDDFVGNGLREERSEDGSTRLH